jgi:adenine phosphoribosyltransferase
MARKKGKLPCQTIEMEYETEYSKSCIQIMLHLIKPNDKIIIVDDLVATGGSLKAATDLVEKCCGKVDACLTVLQVSALIEEAREKLSPIPIHVLLN